MGRHIRKMTIKQATATVSNARSNAVLCRKCQYHKLNWCSVFAKCVGLRDLACGYGRVVIMAAKQAAKRKGKK